MVKFLCFIANFHKRCRSLKIRIYLGFFPECKNPRIFPKNSMNLETVPWAKIPSFMQDFSPKMPILQGNLSDLFEACLIRSLENLLITGKTTVFEVELKFKVDSPCSHYFLLVLYQHFNPIDSFQRLNKIQKMISNKKKRSFKRIGFRIRQNILFYV